MTPRVLVLGLDGATFDLIEPWVREGLLPHFQRLMETGAWGRLESSIPPLSPVAWNTFATGKNPAKHGVFDFIRREVGGYAIHVVNGGDRKATAFWRILDQQGLHVGVINVPMTYPPDRLEHGFVISGFDAPGFESDCVQPPELKETLRRVGYVMNPGGSTRDSWMKSLFEVFEVHKKAFWELLQGQPWDVLVMVFMQLDMAQHLFWREMETQDVRFGDVIPRLYREADALLGEALDTLGKDDFLIVLSDHGLGPLAKTVSINQWLLREGFLVLHERGASRQLLDQMLLRATEALSLHIPVRLKTVVKQRFAWARDGVESYKLSSKIDWERTQAFALGEYGGIVINLRGRERQGVVPAQEYDPLRDEIAAGLLTLCDPDTGEKIVQRVYRREELYEGPYLEQAPDLVLHWNYAYDCRERARLDQQSLFDTEKFYRTVTDVRNTGVHRLHGIFLMCGPPVQPGKLRGACLMDIAPTLLHLLGLAIPEDMDGRVLRQAFRPEWLVQHPVLCTEAMVDDHTAGDSTYSADEEEEVKKRLHSLGYLD